MEITLAIDDAEILRMIEAGEPAYRAGGASALNKASQRIWTLARRELAAEIGVAQKHLQRKARIRRATYRELRSMLSVYTRPLNPVTTTGAVDHRRKGGGVRGGKYWWKGAFLAKGKGARLVAFKRRGRERLPLDAMKIPWQDKADRVLSRLANEQAQELVDKLLPHEIEWRLQRA